jgi:hypothetical protein
VTLSLEQRIDRLESLDAIRQLAHRYAIAVDSRDIDGITSLYVEDVKVAGGATGRDALGAVFTEMLGHNAYSILFVGNHVIDFDDPEHPDRPSRARGQVYCRAQFPQGDEWIVQSICYHDRYDRRDGRWYFHSRNHLLFYGCDMLTRPLDLPRAGQPEFGTGKGSMPEHWPSWQAFRERFPFPALR